MNTKLQVDFRTSLRLLLVSVVIMLISLAACAPAPRIPTQTDEVPRVPKEEVLQKLENGANLLIVDTRSKSEYNAGHIKGAVSAPFSLIEQGEWQPPPDKEIVLYCS